MINVVIYSNYYKRSCVVKEFKYVFFKLNIKFGKYVFENLYKKFLVLLLVFIFI